MAKKWIVRGTGKPKGVALGHNPRFPIPLAERIRSFWELVDVRGKNECWEIKTTPDCQNGYCRFCWGGKAGWAHRFSWLIHNGEIPKGVCVCHKCDNRVCVNPSHLWLGTKGENNTDMFKKGRGVNPPRQDTITSEQVVQIRRIFAVGRFAQRKIGDALGISYKAVESALNPKRWRHIPWT